MAPTTQGALVRLRTAALCLIAVGCSSPAATPTSTAPSSTPTALPDPSVIAIDSHANIFGAGHTSPPAGEGGRGSSPPMWPLPTGRMRTLTFERVTGAVTGIAGTLASNGAGGDHNTAAQVALSGGGGTDIESVGGVSGVVHRGNTMFLVGVFLSDAEPSGTGPERLDFTDREQFETLSPQIAQTFFIGDGGSRRFRIPTEATRLFLGFADGFFWRGPPGYYGNNAGGLEARPKVVVE